MPFKGLENELQSVVRNAGRKTSLPIHGTMEPFFSGISEPFLVLAVLDLSLLVLLSKMLYKKFQNSLTSVSEKSAGLLAAYRLGVYGVFVGKHDSWSILCLLHLLALHLSVLLLGLGLFLHSDANFLVVIASMVWSYQLVLRLFPGPPEEIEKKN